MLIDKELSSHFLDRYQALLGYAALEGGLISKADKNVSALALMQKARNAIAQDPGLLTKAVAAMEKAGEPWPEDMQHALASLRVSHWVYLRDTTSYSVFLETGALEAAYAVKALTEPLKEIMGDSGAVIEAGLMEFHGVIICDALIGLGAWLGSNYRSEFNATLSEYRASGKFYRDRLLPAPPKEAAKPKKSRAKKSAV